MNVEINNDDDDYEINELANIFPMMRGEEFEQLKEDIRKNGLRYPIVLHDNKIIDGRNRYRACKETGADQHFEIWDRKGSLVEYVASVNLLRRQLTKSQLAELSKTFLLELEKEAKTKQVLAGKSTHSNQYKEKVQVGSVLTQPVKPTETVPKSESRHPTSTQRAAKILGVSTTLIKAVKAIDKVSPETIEKIKAGEITVTAATKKLKEAGILPTKPKKVVAQPPPEINNEKIINPPPEFNSVPDMPLTGYENFSSALQYSSLAIKHLSSININDPKRTEALNKVLDCTNKQLKKPALVLKTHLKEELNEKVKLGEISATAAAKIANLGEPEQQDIIRKINAGQNPDEVVKSHTEIPKNLTDKLINPVPLATAMQFARSAKLQIEQIRDDDLTRTQGLNCIIDFATGMLNKKLKKVRKAVGQFNP